MAYDTLQDQSARLARQLAEADGIVGLVPYGQMPNPAFSAIRTIDEYPNTPRAKDALEFLKDMNLLREIGMQATNHSSVPSPFDKIDGDYASF